MVLQTGLTTKGTLYFEYNTIEISDTDSTEDTVNVTDDYVHTIPLVSKDIDSRFIWINSADPVSSFFLKNDFSLQLYLQRIRPWPGFLLSFITMTLMDNIWEREFPQLFQKKDL